MKKKVYDIFPTPIFEYNIENHKEINSELDQRVGSGGFVP